MGKVLVLLPSSAAIKQKKNTKVQCTLVHWFFLLDVSGAVSCDNRYLCQKFCQLIISSLQSLFPVRFRLFCSLPAKQNESYNGKTEKNKMKKSLIIDVKEENIKFDFSIVSRWFCDSFNGLWDNTKSLNFSYAALVKVKRISKFRRVFLIFSSQVFRMVGWNFSEFLKWFRLC